MSECSAKIYSFCSQETSLPGSPVNGCRKEEINTSAFILQDKGLFISLPYLLSLSIKENGIQTPIRFFFAYSSHLLHLPAFWTKSLFLASTSSLLIHCLSCCKRSELGLSNRRKGAWHVHNHLPRPFELVLGIGWEGMLIGFQIKTRSACWVVWILA